MEELKLNETPVRTARNYNINNIKLQNINIPKNINEFKNVQINFSVDENTSNKEIKYGISNLLLEQIKNNSNKKIKINIEKTVKDPIEIKFKFDKENINLIENIEIDVKENVNANVVIKYEWEEDINFYHNGIIKINVNKNANANVTLVNFLNNKANNFITFDNEIEENSKLNYCIIDFGGKNSITNFYSNVKGNNSESNINTIYLGKENRKIDINYIVELQGKNTNTNIEVQGALKDNSVKHFKGTIDFKRGCKKARGNENESCMLLSDTVKSLALPMLLCDEEDVEGNHSTSSGKVDDNQLFYIMSRGFSYNDAMKLIVKAKFNKIIEQLNESLKSEILEKIDEILE